MEPAMSDKCGWVTMGTKDLSRNLMKPFYSTNPAYVAQHREWDWMECDYREAEREVYRQSTGSYPKCVEGD